MLYALRDVSRGLESMDGERGLPPLLGSLIKNEADLVRVTSVLGRRR